MLLFQSIKELEDEMLNGQKLQGPFTADEVNYMLKNKVTTTLLHDHYQFKLGLVLPMLFPVRAECWG